jgi:DNA-binding transcriptional LysR family regulator
MLKLSLDAIEIIDAIAQAGSFSGAGERLHKVTSTISYSVARIESQLGVDLFHRNGPRVQLTPAGAALLEEGRWLVRAAADLESRLKRVATGYESELRIAHDSLFATAALLPEVAAFESLDCGTRLRIAAESMTGTWEALRDNRADLVIAAGEGPGGGGYRASAFGRVGFVFCVAPDHPLAAIHRPLAAEDLVPHTAIVVADSARLLPPRTVGLLSGQRRVTVPDMTAKVVLQRAGLGYGFLPEPLAAADLANGALVARQVSEPKPDETFWIACRPGEQGKALEWWWDRLGGLAVADLLDRQAGPAVRSPAAESRTR